MGVFPCPLPRNNSDKSQRLHPRSDKSSSSSSNSSNSSLYSQPSLPSVPSLTPPEHSAPAVGAQILATLKGHSAHVFSLALAGKYLYSGSSDGKIRVCHRGPVGHDDDDDKLVLVAKSNSSVKSIVVAGDKLFTAHHDHKIRVWKIDDDDVCKNYRCISTLPTLNDRWTRVLRAKNYVNVGRNKKCTWVHHVDAVSAMALSNDAAFLYSVSWDRTVKIWRTSDYKCLESIQDAHDDAINAVALSADGFIYTGSADRKIKVWRKLAGDAKHSLVATLEKHKSAVNALALSSDGAVLYSGACDRSIVVWVKDGGDGGHMVVAGALRGHTKAILCLTVVEDLVCSGSADKTVRIWRRTAAGVGGGGSGMGYYCCLAVLEGHKGPVKCLTAAADEYSSTTGKSYVVYSGSLDFDLRSWKFSVPLT